METVTETYRVPLAGNTDVGSSSTHGKHSNTPQPRRLSAIAEVARRQILKAGAYGSPVRRSPRLSCLPPPQHPEDARDLLDGSSADESDSVHDGAPQLSREATPENDFLPDEPSTVLASKIMRAHDNPSPPPQDLAHPGMNHVPGKDGQFPLLDISAPPSPFRAVNLLERLSQLSEPPFQSPSRPWNPDSADQPAKEAEDIVQHGCKSPTLLAVRVPIDGIRCDVLPSAHAINTPSTPSILKDILSPSSQLVSEPANPDYAGKDDSPSELVGGTYQATITVSPSEVEVSEVPSTLAVVPSPEPDRPSLSDGCPEPLPRTQPLLYPSTSGTGEGSSSEVEAPNPGGKDNDRAELLFTNNGLSASKERRASPTGATSQERLGSLSPDSTKMLTGLFSPSQPTPSIEHILADSTRRKHPPTTPPRIPGSVVTHPDFSRTTIQRPVIGPTPVLSNGSLQQLNSTFKFSSDADDVTRTPAQRVPIQTALSRGIPSVQRTIHLASGLDQPPPGRFPTIRAPVFTRPALDDPSRSPAKRVPIAESVVSPTRGEETSPTRLGFRARSTSIEPRPLGSVPVRSHSVEPCPTLWKHDDGGKAKESIFPMLSTSSRSSAKLPFPLTPSQKSTSDLPSSIPEESEAVAPGTTDSNAALGRVSQRATKSQLKQPSTSSRIPRIGSKPYARPPSKNGKSTVGEIDNVATSTTPSFRFASKSNETGNSNNNGLSTQLLDAPHPAGTLKRKRGGEVVAPPSSHPVMIRQVVPGMLGGKYAPKTSQPVPQARLRSEPTEPSPKKVPQPMKFRKVVDGMLSARYAPSKPNAAQTPPLDSVQAPPSPLSDLSSSSNEELSGEKPSPLQTDDNEQSDPSPTPEDACIADTNVRDLSPSLQDTRSEEASDRPRRTSRTRKPAQQQYVLDVFSANTSTRPPAARRKPQTRPDGDGFMGMSATALKALTTSNTTKNQQTVVVLATEVIRKEGLRPESPTVKVRTILQKQRDEREMRRRGRAERRARMIEEGSGASDTEGHSELVDHESLGVQVHDENESGMVPKHARGPGDEEDYETPERPERTVEPLRFGGVTDKEIKTSKQVKWHRGLSTAIYLDELHPKQRYLPKDVTVVKGCLASTSKNLPLDSLGNLLDIENRPLPELTSEQIVVKKYLYDNDIDPEPIPQKVTRSKSKKSKS